MPWNFYNASGQRLSSTTAAATQAEMEAGSLTNVYVSPGRTQYHPGVAKAWCRITSAGLIVSGDYNVASITDHATGNRSIVWDTDFADTNYICVTGIYGASEDDGKISENQGSIATGSIQVIIRKDTSTADIDTAAAAFGDQ